MHSSTLNDIKNAVDVFTEIRKQRRNGNDITIRYSKRLPFFQSGGFYNTVEGCVLSWCKKDTCDKAREAFERLPGEIQYQLQWSPKNGEFIERADLWRNALWSAMTPKQYYIAIAHILHWYIHIKQIEAAGG